jgi:hypothetical protein
MLTSESSLAHLKTQTWVRVDLELRTIIAWLDN